MAFACGCGLGPGAPSSLGAGAGAAAGSLPELGGRLLVLARPLRLRTADDFRETTRQGRRCSTYTVVVHALFDDSPPPPRVGIVVSKAVGMAVRRNRVKRRLRAVLGSHVAALPGGRVVVRALPPSAQTGFASLAGDVDLCVSRLKAAAA